jgi:hypothetical protein
VWRERAGPWRDVATRRLLEQFGVTQDITATADPALLLEPLPLADSTLERQGPARDCQPIGMSVREPGGTTQGPRGGRLPPAARQRG